MLGLHIKPSNLNSYVNNFSTFSLSIIITLVSLSIYFILIGQPVWGTNDDVGMSMMSAGVWFSNYPTSDIMFIHHYYGWFIKSLVIWKPDVPWYGIIFIVLVIISIFILTFSTLRINKTFLRLFIIQLSSIGIIIPALSHLQFTIVSGLLSLSGVVLLLSLLIKSPKGKIQTLIFLISIIFFIHIAALIRFESMLLILILSLPFYIVFIWQLTKSIPFNNFKRQYLVPILLIGSIMIIGLTQLAFQQDKHINNSKDWKKWYHLNRLKSEFTDYSHVKYNEKTRPYFEAVGWSEIHFNMIMSWQYIDPIEFAPEKFDYIVSKLNKEKLLQQSIESPNIYKLTKTAISALGISTILLILIFSIVLTIPITKNNIILLGILFLTSISIFLYLYIVLNRVPFRVLILFPFTIIYLFLLLTKHNFSFFQKYLSSYTNILYVFLCCSILYGFLLEFRNARQKVRFTLKNQKILETQIQTWTKNLPKNAIIYNTGSALNLEAHLPLKSLNYFKPIKNLISSGCSNQSPHMQKKLKRLGLEDSFYHRLAKKENVFLFSNKEKLNLKKIVLIDYYKKKGIKLILNKEPKLPGLYRMVFIILPTRLT